MIACLERFVHENDNESGTDDDVVSTLCNAVDLQGSIDCGAAADVAGKDFGGMHSVRPRLVKAAPRSPNQTGRRWPIGGLVLDMRLLEGEGLFHVSRVDGSYYSDVGGGQNLNTKRVIKNLFS